MTERERLLRAAEVSRLVGDGNYTKLMRQAVRLTAEQMRRELDERAGNQIHRLESGHTPLMGRLDD